VGCRSTEEKTMGGGVRYGKGWNSSECNLFQIVIDLPEVSLFITRMPEVVVVLIKVETILVEVAVRRINSLNTNIKKSVIVHGVEYSASGRVGTAVGIASTSSQSMDIGYIYRVSTSPFPTISIHISVNGWR
jgi:hypothetical protein